MSPSEISREWFECVWNQRDRAKIDELMAEDCDLLGLELPERGRAGFIGFWEMMGATFADSNVEVLEVVECGDQAIGHCRFTATHRESGKPVDYVFSFSGRWKDGKVVETRNIVDFASMLAQLGVMDPAQLRGVFAS